MFTVLLITAALSAPADDPLAEARAGRLQCHQPDVARKTCQSLAGYTFEADGVVLNQAEVLLNPSPLIVMRTVSPVTVRDGAICGRRAGLETARFTIEGQDADPQTTELLRGRVESALAPVLNQEICTRYAPDGDALRASVTVGGQPREEFGQRVLWVSPTDGYAVRP